jgi:2-deoxy-D-gluconate 3-dehydrogenase
MLTGICKRDEKNTVTKQYIEGLGMKAQIYTADLSSQDEVSNLTKKVLGDSKDVSILLNCAGIQRRHPSHLFPTKDWDEVCRPLTSLLVLVGPSCTDVGFPLPAYRFYKSTYRPCSHFAETWVRTC